MMGAVEREHTEPKRVCAGPSMSPTVMLGDTVNVRGLGPSVRSGEAVLFLGARGDYEVLHRYVFKVPFLPYFVHRGDATFAAVGLAHCNRIIGTAALPPRRPSVRDYAAGVLLVAKRAASRVRRARRGNRST